MRLPEAGSKLELVSVIPLGTGPETDIAKTGIRGQGIAGDRSSRGVLYGIIRATSADRGAVRDLSKLA